MGSREGQEEVGEGRKYRRKHAKIVGSRKGKEEERIHIKERIIKTVEEGRK